MKKIIYCFTLSFLLLFSNYLFSQQTGWYSQTSGTTSNLNSTWFQNTSTGIVVGNAGAILRTTNGGTNWVIQSSGTTMHLFSVYFANQSTGWVVGDLGTILKTTNAGVSWNTQTSNTYYQLRSISFQNATTGFIAGWYGTVLKTVNGGSTWTLLSTNTTSNLLGVAMTINNVGFAVGWLGTILSTANGGTNWAILTSGTITFSSVNFYNAQIGIVVGEQGRIQKTTNSGTSWVIQSSGTSNWLMGITTPHTNFSYVVGEQGTIRVTTNAGTNWYSQASNTSSYLNGVNFPDTLNGWAVGDYGTIIHTTTGGWLPPTAPSLSSPGNNSTCVSLTPNLTWGSIFPPSCYYRVQIATNSNFNTTVLDSSGTVYTNLNVPANKLSYGTQYYWRVVATNQVGTGPWSGSRSFTTTYPTPQAPALVTPVNNSTGISLTPLLNWDSVTSASSFRIRLSADSTFTTNLIDTVLTLTQYQVYAGKLLNNTKYFWRVNASNSCATGSWSQTWNFRTMLVSGLVGNTNEIPMEYKLYNNYPNPFNPITTIKFGIPENVKVKLNVYDVTGKEISVLVDDELKAGLYEYQWSASNFASGIYFYRIQAGDFVYVKKMMLIK